MESDSDKITNLAEPSDEDLVKLAQHGDIESGNRLFIRYGRELEWRAQNLGASKDDVKDWVQDAYRIAWERIGSFGAPYLFLRWMYRILDKVSKEKRRAKKRGSKIFGPEGSDEDIEELAGENVADFRLDRGDLAKLLEALPKELERLSADCQKIGRFMLKHVDKNGELPSKREMEDVTGIPATTALRCRERVLEIWKPLCKRRGFWPLI